MPNGRGRKGGCKRGRKGIRKEVEEKGVDIAWPDL